MEVKQIYITETNNHATKSLNACLLDIAKVESFAKSGEISIKEKGHNEVVFKPDSDTLKDMGKLSATLKDKTLKYAFDKKRMFKAKRQLSEYLKESITKA